MNSSTPLKCLHCGAPLEVQRDSIKVQCRYCKRVYENLNKELTADLCDISNLRQLRDFIQAEDLCLQHRRQNPGCGELYWQSLLIEYGIVYVTDKVKKVPVPTFFHHTYEKGHELSSSENYRLALEHAATKGDADFYRSQVEELDAILKRHFELIDKEPAYNIFISFKSSEVIQTVSGEEMVIETQDSKTGKDIYDLFTKKKYNVFFSPESIGKDKSLKGMDYEPRILKALQTSQAMVLIASKYDYLMSEWVENEWKRYMYFIERNKKQRNSLIIVYFGKPPKLPAALGGKIEHTMIDALSINFKEELIRALEFVKPGGRKTTKVKRIIETDFEGETLDYSASSKRINIGQSRNINHITASEAREMQNANLYLVNKNYPIAYQSFKKIADNSPTNGKAYFGMFLSKVKVKLPEKYISGSMRGASPTEITDPKDLIYNFKSVNQEAYELIEAAINNPTDEDFSDNVISMLMYQVAKAENSKQIVKLLAILSKYVPDKTVKNLLDIVKGHVVDEVKKGNVKFAKELYETAKENLFIPENNAFNMAFLRDFANALYFSGYYDMAVEYFNTYLKASHEAAIYWNLLGCRLKGTPMQSFKLKIKADDDASQKEPKNLDPDEIIERILICSKCDFDNVTVKDVMRLLSYQIQNNYSNYKPFIECVGNCVLSVKGELEYLNFLYKMAMVMVFERRFADAKIYFAEMDSVIHESDTIDGVITPSKRSEMLALIRWGLLKCRLKAIDDYEICRSKKRLEEYAEYREALNSATEAQHKYFSSVYSAHQNRQEEFMKKFACTPELRKKNPSAREIMPQFGVVESFYSPVALKTKAAAKQQSGKKVKSFFTVLFLAAVAAAIVYFGFIRENTVTFDAMGYGENVSVTSKAFGKLEKPANPVRHGYTFIGWYDVFGNEWDFDNSFVIFDTTLTPKFERGSEGLKFDLEASYGGALVVGYEGTDPVVYIPDTYDGVPVIRIESQAFKDNGTVEKVVLSSNVTSIGYRVFENCARLSAVYIPSSVELSGTEVFYNTSPKIFFEDGVSTEDWPYDWNYTGSDRIYDTYTVDGVTDEGFAYVLKTVSVVTGDESETPASEKIASIEGYFGAEFDLKIPSSIEGAAVKYIGKNAFAGERNLVRVTIPEGLVRINQGAFASCPSLVSFISYATGTVIDDGAFDKAMVELYCPDNTFDSLFPNIPVRLENPDESRGVIISGGYVYFNYTDGEGNKVLGIYRYVGNSESITLPDSILGIEEPYEIFSYAFSGSYSLKDVTLSGGVFKVGEHAFSSLVNLETVFISESVTEMGPSVFMGSEKAVIFMAAAEIPAGFNQYWNSSDNSVYLGMTSERGVTEKGIRWIKKADSTVLVLGLVGKADDEYDSSNNLTLSTYDLTIPEHINGYVVNEIDENALKNRYLIVYLSLPNTLEKIVPGMLSGCVSLEGLAIPGAGIVNLSDTPETVDGEELYELISEYPFGAVFGTQSYSFYFNGEYHYSKSVAQTAFERENGRFTVTYQVPQNLIGVKAEGGKMASYAFENMTTLQGVSLEVEGVSDYALLNCTSLAEVGLGAEVKSIGSYAFKNCTSLVSPNQMTNSLNAIPDSVAYIGDGAYFNCSKLETMKIGSGVTELPEGLLAGCGSLRELTVPFIGKTKTEVLTSDIVAEETIGHLFDKTVPGYNAIEISFTDGTADYYVPASLATVTVTEEKVIATAAFFDLTSIATVNIPSGTTAIGDYAFYNCSSITEFTLPNSCESIGESAFDSVTALSKFTIYSSSSLKSIGSFAFYGDTALERLDIPASVTTVGSSIGTGATSLVIYCAANEPGEGWESGWAGSVKGTFFGYDGAYHTYEFITGDAPMIESITSQSAITLPTSEGHPSKTHFIGWYDNPEFIGKPISQSCYYSTEKTKLYARWENAALGKSEASAIELVSGEDSRISTTYFISTSCYYIVRAAAGEEYEISFEVLSSGKADFTAVITGSDGAQLYSETANGASAGQKFTYTFTAEADTHVIVRIEAKASGLLTGSPYVVVKATKIEEPAPVVPVPDAPEMPEGDYPTE